MFQRNCSEPIWLLGRVLSDLSSVRVREVSQEMYIYIFLMFKILYVIIIILFSRLKNIITMIII